MSEVKQRYKGFIDEADIKTNYPNYEFEIAAPIGSEIDISVPRDVYRRLQQQLAYLQLAQGLRNE